MAGITVNTKLDTSPVRMGINEMNRAIQSLRSLVVRAGRNMNASMVGYAKAMSTSAATTSEANDRIADLDASYRDLLNQIQRLANTKIDTMPYAEIKKEIEKATNALARLQDQQQKLKALGKDVVPTKEYAALSRAIDRANTKQQMLSRTIVSLKTAISDNNARSDEIIKEMTSGGPIDFSALAEEYEVVNKAIEKYHARLVSVQDKYNDNKDAIKAMVDAQNDLRTNGKDVMDSDAMRRSQYDIQKTTQLLQQLQQQKQAMEDAGTATVMGDTTKEYGDMLSRAAQMEEKLSETVEKVQEDTKPIHIQEWEKMPTLTGMVAEGFAKIQNAANIADYAMSHPLEALDRMVPVVASKLAALAITIGKVAFNFARIAVNQVVSFLRGVATAASTAASNLARIAVRSAISFLQQLGDAARTAASQLARLVSSAGRGIGSGIVNGFKSLTSAALQAGKAITSLGERTKSSRGGLQQGLRMLVRYGFGVRSVYMLVRRLRTAVVDAFKNMAQKVPEVNKTLSSLASSMDRLKNSLATAFQPVLTAIAPYVTKLMDLMSDALTKVGMFFAALTGQNYVYKATKANIDYAKSLNNTSKAAQETKNQLLGFDHLNILSDTSSSSDTSASTSDFEQVPVNQDILDYIQKLKNYFKNGQFYEMGQQFADFVNTFFVSTKKFAEAGEKIGKVVNSIVDIYNGFMDSVAWEKIGESLGAAFDGLLESVKWDNLGKALSQHINALTGIIFGFINDKERWVKAGKALADLVWGFFGNIKWDEIGTVIGTAITNLSTMITEFADKFPWKEAGGKLDEAFRNMVNSIDIEEVYTAFSTMLKGILDLIMPILTDDATWDKICEGFKTFLHNFFQDDALWTKAKTAVKTALKRTLRSMRIVFSDQSLFAELGGRLSDFLNDVLGDTQMWKEVGGLANDMMKGVLTFGENFINDFDPKLAAENIKTALGEIQWGKIAERTWNLLKTALGKAGSFVDALFSKSTEGVSDAEKKLNEQFNAKPLGTRMALIFQDAFDEVKKAFPKIAATVWDAIRNAFAVAGDFVSTLFSEKTDGLSGQAKVAAEAFNAKPIAERIAIKLKEAFDELKGKLPGIASDVWAAIRTAFSSAGDFVDALLTEPMDTTRAEIDKAYEKKVNDFNAKSIASRVGEKIKNALESVPWNTITSAVWNGLKTAFSKTGDFISSLLSIDTADMSSSERMAAIGKALGAKISDGMSEIEWGEFGTQLSEMTVGLFKAIAALIKEAREQGKIQEAFSEFINNIEWDKVAAAVVEAAWEAFKSAGAMLWKAVVDGMANRREELETGEKEQAKAWAGGIVDAFYNAAIDKLMQNDDVKAQYNSIIDNLIQSADMYGGGETNAERFYNGFIGTVMENGEVKEEYRSAIEEIWGSVDNFKFGASDAASFFLGLDDVLDKVPIGEDSAFYMLMSSIYESIPSDAFGENAGESYISGSVNGVGRKKDVLANALQESATDFDMSEETAEYGEQTANAAFDALIEAVSDTTVPQETVAKSITYIFNQTDTSEYGTDYGQRFYDSLRALLSDDSGKVGEDLKQIISPLFSPTQLEAFTNGELTTQEFYEALTEAASTELSTTGNSFKAEVETMMNNVDAMTSGQATAEIYYDNFLAMITSNDEVKEEYKNAIDELLGVGTSSAIDKGDYTADMWFEGWNNAVSDNEEGTKTILQNALESIVSAMENNVLEQGSPSQRAKRSGAWYMEGIAEGVASKESSVTQAVNSALNSSVVNTVDNKWSEASGKQSSILTQMTNNMLGSMQDMTSTSESGNTNTAKPFYDKFGDIMLAVEQCMRSARDYFNQYMDDMVKSGGTSMNTLNSNIYNIMSQIARYDWSDIGRNICNGMVRGMNDNWNWVTQTAWNLAYAAKQQAEWALGIASPSKVFQYIGQMTGAGLAEGLDDSQNEVLGSISDMANAMIDEMQETDLTADMDVNEQTMLDGIQNALSLFSDNIENSFTRLTDRLQSIAEKVTYRMPEVAAGTVVPYAVQGTANINTDDISVVLEKSNDDLIRAMIQLVNNQTSALISGMERYCSAQGNSDRQSNTDAVISEINRRARAMGKSPILV